MADTDFEIVERIKLAAAKSEIALMLLRAPDAIILTRGPELANACRACGFNDAVHFITMRSAALDAVRNPAGELPQAVLVPLEVWRQAVLAFASGAA